MLIISIRNHFTDSDSFLQNDSYVFGNPNNELPYFSSADTKNVLASLAGQRVLLLVHGYNSEFDEMFDAYSLVNAQAQRLYDTVIGFSWPGGDHGWEWFSAKSRANAAGLRLRKVLRDLAPHMSIDIMSHSLGGRVAMKALRGGPVRIRNYYATAPAVDNECLEPGEEFFRKHLACENLYVMHSCRDQVLKLAYSGAEFDGALGLTGPEDNGLVLETQGLYAVNCKNLVHRHGGYKHCPEVFAYIEASHAGAVGRFTTL